MSDSKLLDHFPSNLQRLKDEAGDETVPTIVGYAGLALLPIVGAAVQNWIIERRIKRIEDFLYDLCLALKDHEERVNRDKIGTEEFEYLFTRTIDSTVSKQRKEKARFYQNLLVNHLISEENNIDEEEIYLSRLDDLSYIELVVLSWFHDGRAKKRTGGVNEENEIEKKRRIKLVRESVYTEKQVDYAITVSDNKGYFEQESGSGPINFIWKFWNFRGWLNEMSIDFLDYILTIKQ